MPRICHPFHTTLTAHTHRHTHCKIYLCKKVEKTLSGRKVCDLFLRSMRKMCEFESINYRQPNTEFNPGTNIPPYIYHLCAWLCVAYNLGHTHMYTVHTHTHTHTYRIRIFMAKSENVCIRLVCGIGNTKDRKCHMAI